MSDWGTTTRIRAVITLATGEVHPGYLHLLDDARYASGCEPPLDMLNRTDGFLPVTQEDGNTVFLSRQQIVMVLVEWPPQGAERPALPGSPSALHVELANGEEFLGLVQEPLPPPRSRALDYLNATSPFFLLETDSGTRLINRWHVRLIRPLD